MSFVSGALTGFERFWNSSFGLPQQLIFRAMRVASGDASFFSEKGFGDAALIPGFGALDSQREDVTAKEMVQRVNQVTGLELDEEGFGAQLGVGIGTDPLSFMTSGLTAGAKTIAAVTRSLSRKAVQEAVGNVGVKGALKLSRTELSSKLDGVLGAGKLASKDRRIITRARKALDNVEGEDLGKALEHAGKREQVLAAPIIGAAFGPKIKVSDEYASWFQLLRDKSKTNTALSYLGSAPLQQVPIIKHVTAAVAGVAAGVRNAGVSAFSARLLNEAAKGNLTELADVMQPASHLARKLGDPTKVEAAMGTVLRHVETGNAHGLMRAVYGSKEGHTVEEALSVLGVKSMDEITEGTLVAFRENYDQAVSAIQAQSTVFGLTEAAKDSLEFQELSPKAFGLGRGLETLRRKIFVSDVSAKSLDKAVRAGRDILARDTEQIMAQAQKGARLLKEDADAIVAKTEGAMTGEDLEALHLSVQQLGLLPEELEGFELLDPITQASRAGDFAQRMLSVARELKFSAGKLGNPATDDVLEALAGEGGIFDDLQTVATFDSPDVIRAQAVRPDSVHRADQHLLQGEGVATYQGQWVGNLTDNQLASAQRKLRRKATRARNQGELTTLVRTDPDLSAAAASVGLTPAELADQAFRRRKAPDMFRVSRLELDAMQANTVQAAADTMRQTGLDLTDKVEVIRRMVASSRPIKRLNSGTKVPGTLEALRPVVAILKSKGFKDVDDILDTLTAARFIRPSSLDPAIHKLNAQGKSVFSLSQRILKDVGGDVEDLKLLSKAERADLNKLGTVEGLRAENKTGRHFMPGDEIEPPRLPSDIQGQSQAGATVELTEEARTVAKLQFMAKELVRGARSQKPVSPAFYTELIDTLNVASQQVAEPVYAALKEMGAGRFIEFSDDIRGRILDEAMQTGTIGASRPLAYVARIGNPDTNRALDQLLGRSEVRGILDKQLPNLSSQYRRSANAHTIGELNEIHKALDAAGNTEIAAELAKHMETMGLTAGRYTESPLESMLTRLSQSQHRLGVLDTVGNMFDEAAKEGSAIAGKVVRVVRDEGTIEGGLSNPIGPAKLGVTTAERTATSTTLAHSAERAQHSVTGIIVETHEGKEIFVEASQFGHRISGVKMGAFDGTTGKDVNKAFARATGSGGRVDKSKLFGHQPMSGSDVAALEGEFVLFGEDKMWSGMFDSFAKQWDGASELMGIVDTGINIMKRFQTTYRPVFHMFNRGSAYGQARIAGATMKGMTLGTLDGYRFLNQLEDFLGEYDSLHAVLGTEAASKGRTGFFKRNVPGHKTGNVTRLTREAGRDGAGIESDFMFRAVNGDVYQTNELLDAFIDANLFSTHVSQGLRATSSVPKRMQIIRDSMLNPKAGVEGVVRKVVDKTDNLAEASEVNARLMVTFSLMHSGQTPIEAAKNAALVSVPYHQLTGIERNVAKRIFTYYSFPRHYTGQAYKFFAENPASASNLAHAVISEGGIKEKDGRLVIDTKAGRLNVGRLNPNLEALGTLTTWGRLFADVMPGDHSESVGRQLKAEGLRTALPIVGDIGGPAQVGLDLLQGDISAARKEVSDAFWFSRALSSPHDPLKESSGLTRANDAMWKPLGTIRTEHEKRVIVARYNDLKRTLTRKLQENPDDPSLVAIYTRELQTVEEVLQAKLAGTK